MDFENRGYAFSRAFVDELARSGLRHAVICPGSRSSPLAISFGTNPAVKTWLHLDERSAAFFALGMARALGQPVAVVCTSGTAAANFYPAVVEARYAGVPLLLLTADRPPELWEWGAAQTIDQTRLYGAHVKWSVQLATPEATADLLRYVRALACRSYAVAAAAPSGPVHVNLAFRDPLVPARVPADIPAQPYDPDRDAWDGRAGGRPYISTATGRIAPGPAAIGRLVEDLRALERGLIICGPQYDAALPAQVARLAACLGYPVLADPLSQLRAGPHDKSAVVVAYDTFLKDPDLPARLAPQIVLRLGDAPTSKPLSQFLDQHHSARQVVIRAEGWSDPGHTAWDFIHADPGLVCQGLAADLGAARSPSSWLSEWLRLDSICRAALQSRLHRLDELFEGKVFSELADLLPAGSGLFAGSSMPVRDLDAYFPLTDKPVRCLGNRGVNGIDGVVSTALGHAAVAPERLVLVLGDISLYHDLNGLLAAKLHRLNATIVVVNNDGGGIFSFLPQAAYPDVFERFFGTPHGLRFGPAADLYGLAYTHVDSWPAFRSAVASSIATPGTALIEVPGDRARNVALHRELTAAALDAVRQKVG
ncbi:MAG: 2-succinyl-5-enolpyruvyl-6-hydroxy-3-cyclohexene-1-carboxylic-acid synthase [Chloroflexi bacterium]|nr:2-succinyl-5-enolpyruvyl-6-hydroxy-3-cyclohexene-1-carboxylic-acid synthase [Chloroflexota bacterium]